jgi:hypothetical protein
MENRKNTAVKYKHAKNALAITESKHKSKALAVLN